jgi:general secretion pathway protein B
MSYILEALKKSQRERELGQVPTLDTPNFPGERAGARPSLWILLAVILAALAVVIALYSAIRGSAPIPDREVAVVQPDELVVSEPARHATDTPSEPSATQPDSRAATVESEPRRSDKPTPAPISKPSEPTPAVLADVPAPPPRPQSRERGSPVAAEAPPEASYERITKAPLDLIADIEAFKREVRDEESVVTKASKPEDAFPPQKLRLPKDVRKRLPEFIMSAHIYDEDPSKRFVLINGLKTREGEESREEITVKQILPDGAVLSFEGHEFFQHR